MTYTDLDIVLCEVAPKIAEITYWDGNHLVITDHQEYHRLKHRIKLAKANRPI